MMDVAAPVRSLTMTNCLFYLLLVAGSLSKEMSLKYYYSVMYYVKLYRATTLVTTVPLYSVFITDYCTRSTMYSTRY